VISYLRHPMTHTWVILVLATLGSWSLGFESAAARRWVAPLILLIALTKCRIVMRNYMEVRHAPDWLRWACDGWLALNLALIGSSYWFAV